MRKALHSVVVKTTSSKCNLDCTYCFYLNKEKKYANETVMDDATRNEFLKQLIDQSGNSVGIIWQGGEPTLAGTSFFQKAIKETIQYSEGKYKVVSNMLQTNGYFISDDMLQLMREYSFLTGLSIDGPEDLHNTYRKTISGKDSWGQAMKSWHRLKHYEIETNILCCVTRNSVDRADEIYDFFKTHQMKWLQFIPVMEKNREGKLLDFSISSEDWGMFLDRIFKRWFDDFVNETDAPSIRFIEDVLHMQLGMDSPECTYMDACGTYLVLEHNGDVFSCDFLVDDKTLIGNIHSNRLIDMLNSPQQTAFGNAKSIRPSECMSCEWLNHCYGGCPKYRDENNKYFFCIGWKYFLNQNKQQLKDIAEAYKTINGKPMQTFDGSGMF